MSKSNNEYFRRVTSSPLFRSTHLKLDALHDLDCIGDYLLRSSHNPLEGLTTPAYNPSLCIHAPILPDITALTRAACEGSPGPGLGGSSQGGGRAVC